MKAIFNNTEYDAIWKNQGLSDNQIGNIRKVLIEYGGDMSKMIGDVPIYTYITRKNGMREKLMDMWLIYGPKEQTVPFIEKYGEMPPEIIDSSEYLKNQ